MDESINKFCKSYNFPENDALLLLSQMDLIEFKKHHKIIREGERNSNLFIINEGIIRAYSLVDGIDITHWFVTEGDAFFSVWSYISDSCSRITLETITDCSAYSISRTKLNELYNSSLTWSNIGRRIVEQHCLLTENWLMNWERPTAKERYLAVLEQTPELFKHVPLQQIASYLRITPQSLSRIRAQL